MTELQIVTMVLLFAIILMIIALICIIAQKLEAQKKRESNIIESQSHERLDTSYLRIVNAA